MQNLILRNVYNKIVFNFLSHFVSFALASKCAIIANIWGHTIFFQYGYQNAECDADLEAVEGVAKQLMRKKLSTKIDGK